jgi:hypothetical protein
MNTLTGSPKHPLAQHDLILSTRLDHHARLRLSGQRRSADTKVNLNSETTTDSPTDSQLPTAQYTLQLRYSNQETFNVLEREPEKAMYGDINVSFQEIPSEKIHHTAISIEQLTYPRTISSIVNLGRLARSPRSRIR